MSLKGAERVATEEIQVKYELIAKEALATLNKLRGQFKELQTGVDDVGKSSNKTASLLGQMSKNLSNSIKGFIAFSIGAKLVRTFTTAIQEGFDASIRFEDALIGVGKTTNLSADALNGFGREAEKLAQRIPVTSEELLKLSQVAGQLGVRGSDNLLKFAETAARLARSTDLEAETAITGLTRIIRLTGESDESIDRLASSLVQLGNNFNATESQILSAALALSQTTSGFNIGSDEVLGFATAIAEAGLGSEKAATAIGGVLTDISKSLSNGGKAARNFAKATGLSLEEVTKIINEDAGKALDLFLGSLSDVSDNTVELTRRLGELGVAEKRETQVIQSLVKLRQTQTNAIRQSSEAYQTNNALTIESDKAFSTLSASLTKAAETASQLAKAIIEESGLATALKAVADQVALISGFWANYIRGTQQAAVASKTLTTDVKALGEEFGIAFDNFSADSVESVSKAADLLVPEFKRIQDEIDKIKSGEITIFGAQNRQKELERLEELRVKTIEVASDLRMQARLLQEEQDAADSARNTNLRGALDERLSIIEQFQQASLQANDLYVEEEKLREQLRNDERLQGIREQLGEEVALELLANQQRLLNEAKTEEEILKVREKFALEILKTQKKSLEAQKKQQQDANFAMLSAQASLFGALASLASVGGRKLFNITKALNLAQAITSGVLAVQRALAEVPYPANLVAASAMGIQTAANVARISQTQPPAFQDGGIVPGNSVSGDQVMARVNSGEMILNRQQQGELFRQINSGTGGQQEVVVHTSINIDGEEIGKAVSRQVANGLSLGDVV